MSESEQNKTEEPTPFKLRKAREKGQIAKGTDLGYFASLLGLFLFAIVAGQQSMARLAEVARRTVLEATRNARDPSSALEAVSQVYAPAIKMLAMFGGSVVFMVILFEIIQIRGPVFSAHPLKPDFNRINPGKGLKRIFSMRTIKEALKNIIKMSVYAGAAYLVIRGAVRQTLFIMDDAGRLAEAMYGQGIRLVLSFACIAIFFTALDQIISRGEFTKQMRMSKREVKRETRDREGEPRQRQKRRELHRQFAETAQGMRDLPGSDVIVTNPQHIAVALAYDASRMTAPKVIAKGQELHALAIRHRASRLGIPIIEDKPLARALYAEAKQGREIPGAHFNRVADLYIHLRRAEAARRQPSGAKP